MLMTFSGLRTSPLVMIWKNTMSATSAKIMPNWRVSPPKMSLSFFIKSPWVSG